MQILGIVLGFAILIYVTYKNWSVYLASFLASVVVILCAGLPLTETIAQSYIGGIGAIFTSLFGMFLFGSVMAKIYAVSGAASSIANTLCGAFLKDSGSEKKKQIMGILVVICASAIICYGGINAAIVIITIYPIALAVFERCNIPKRFVPGVILGGCCTFALSGPGAPQPTNMIPSQILGTSPAAGLIPGIVGIIVEVIVMVLVLNKMISNAKAKGESFAYGPKDSITASDKAMPGFWISLIPLVVLFVMFNVFSVNIIFCTLASSVLSLVLFYKYMDKDKIKSYVNEGFVSALTPVGSIGAVFGFATCVQQVPAFQNIVDSVLGIKVNPILLCVISVAFLCALTGGSTTGQSIVLPIVQPVLESKGLAASVMHRIATFSATTLDSLPHSGTILMTVTYSDLKMKDSYPAIFVTTTLATTMATAAVTLLLWLCPWLA